MRVSAELFWFLDCHSQLVETLYDVMVSIRYSLHCMMRCSLLVMNATLLSVISDV